MKLGLDVLAYFLSGLLLLLVLELAPAARPRSRWLTTGGPLLVMASGADLAFAVAGALTGWAIADGVSRCRPHGFRSAALPSFGLAFLWVNGYGYRYNLSSLNASSFSLFAFVLWGLGLCLVIATARRFEAAGLRRWTGFLLLCLMYWLNLMALEHVGYQWLGIREVSRGVFHAPLILGLVHGPWFMKLFYLSAGPVLALADGCWRNGRLQPARRLPPESLRSA